MDNTGLTASDVALLSGNEGMGGWNGMIWLFAILAMMGGGFGWGGYGNRYEPQFATQDFVQNGFNFNDLQNQNRDILTAITNGTAQSVATTNQTFHDTLFALSDKYNELQRDLGTLGVGQAQLLANQNECCGSTKMMIAENRYENAMNTSQIIQAVQAEGNATRAKMDQNKIEALQQQVNELQMQNQMQGVVRYPNGWTYNAGTSPFCQCGC